MSNWNDTPEATGLLNITQNDVMEVIRRIIVVDGLDAARAAFKQMNEFFSGLRGWAQTTEAVYALIADKRKEEKQQQIQEQLEVQRAAAPNLVVMSHSTSDARNIGKTEMDIDVNSPGNNIAKMIKIGDKHDEN
jgi:tRNA A37 threonylcarbamoyladenosine synthetase subunit TsaC/SUA5/YrdC